MRFVRDRTNVWLVSLKLAVQMGLVERQAIHGYSNVHGSSWTVFLVGRKDSLRRDERSLGAPLPGI
tara:strand:+ start:1741 stop:1938 length:198 start_codon:yes stop_codon:yes gene_type:complete